MKPEEILTDIGMTNNETKTYLSLLELGSTTVTNISEKTKLHRTNVYDTLKKLTNKGIVSYMKQDNITFYEASDPNILIRIIKEKEENLKKIIPQLILTKKLAENTSEITLIKGINSFIDKLFELLNHEEEILVLGMPEKAIKLLGARIFPFHKTRIQKNIPLKQIYSKELEKKIKKINDEKTKTKICENQDFNVSTIICNKEILITEWTKEITTLRIQNESITNNYKAQFQVLWKNSKK
ncbi:ArsR family transcriptional regulator [Candidatus Woesearchaeota archaeon]|nr:ArsR family transcriptional regulator [Candidatus Woesearchaeota archaeon]